MGTKRKGAETYFNKYDSGMSKKKKGNGEEETSGRDTQSKTSLKGKTMEEDISNSKINDDGERSDSSQESEVP